MNDKKRRNAWHNVHGIENEELQNAATWAYEKYGDIIELPHHISKKRPQMPKEKRAAQFSPFAALTGYEAAIERTGADFKDMMEHDTDREAFFEES